MPPKSRSPSRDPTQEPAVSTSELSQVEDYGDFPPGTIVLAKLKSFPPWPAIVIPYESIPEKIQASKPKNPGRVQSRGKRKSQGKNSVQEPQDSRLWCVRFLRDDTFMWATSKDISLLTTEQIEEFLKSKKAKKVIKSAYEMALNPPDVEEFIIYGSDGKPMDIDNEADDADFQEGEYSGEDEDEDDDDGSVDEIEDDIDLEIDTPSKKTSSRKSTSPTKRKKATPARKTKRAKVETKKTPKKGKAKGKGKKKVDEYEEDAPEEEEDLDTSSDEDWDVEVDVTEEPVCTTYPDPKVIAASIKKRAPMLKKARFQLQKTLLSSQEIPNDLSTAVSTLDTLEKLEDVQLSLVNKSGLHKVLFTILKRPDLETRDKKLRKRVSNLVKNWYHMEIEPQQNWTFDDVEDSADVSMTDAADGSATPAEAVTSVKDESNGH